MLSRPVQALGCLCSRCLAQRNSMCSVTLMCSPGMVTSSDSACACWPTGLVFGGEAGTRLRAPPFLCLFLRDSSGNVVMVINLDSTVDILGFASSNLGHCALCHSPALLLVRHVVAGRHARSHGMLLPLTLFCHRAPDSPCCWLLACTCMLLPTTSALIPMVVVFALRMTPLFIRHAFTWHNSGGSL